jgi:hypothetical protein
MIRSSERGYAHQDFHFILRDATVDKNGILINLSESTATKFGKEEFEQQSFPQKVFTAIWWVESEVNNGGFSQYFLNESAESASFVSTALTTIGAPKTANICDRAIIAAFPGGLPKSVDAIQSIASSFSESTLSELESLDQEFLSYPHNLTDRLFAYVSAHPEEFGALPKPDDA